MKHEQEFSLSDILNPEVIRVGASARDRDDAIRIAGRVLVDAQIIEERYIDAMIQTCDELGPYIELVPGVAVPHASPDKGALGIGISVVVLKEPVDFGHAENGPVSVILAFASNDEKKHIKVLSELAHFLGNSKRIDDLCCAKTCEEVIQIMTFQD
jgi:mannitol/fructose-specific phosphotransferase system IIA component (Ntr-type)